MTSLEESRNGCTAGEMSVSNDVRETSYADMSAHGMGGLLSEASSQGVLVIPRGLPTHIV